MQFHTRTHIDHGRVHSSTDYVVKFSDGYSWKYGRGGLWSCTVNEEENAVRFIVSQSGKALEYTGSD